MGFAMTTNEAIMYLAIGFMIIIGIWLTALTYLVLKRYNVQNEQEEPGSEKTEEEIPKEEDTEIEAPAVDEEKETHEEEPSEEEKTQ